MSNLAITNPLVSILIPTYNSAKFIARAAGSALSQTYEPTEIVVVDNASDDGTYEIVQRYASKNANIRVFQNSENVGPVRNWLRCAEEARGQYACLLFSDDWYERTFLEETLPFLRDPEVGFVYTAVSGINESECASVSEPMYRCSEEGRLPISLFVKQHLYLGMDDAPLSPGCAMFRLSDLRIALSAHLCDEFHVGYMQHGAGPDLLAYLLTSTRYPYFAYVAKPLVNFLGHEKNLSMDKSVNLAYALIKAWFACRYGKSFKDIDLRRFRAAHLWRLWRLGSLKHYRASLSGDASRYDLAWGDLFRHLAVKLRGLKGRE